MGSLHCFLANPFEVPYPVTIFPMIGKSDSDNENLLGEGCSLHLVVKALSGFVVLKLWND
ncbi:MAG: hypothetical protein H6Q04_1561 [Acidobacteria bacterium]|jgi:hypothetical protein|nr:hypothetical protein [Acidobacteriota bacterium]